MGGGGKSSTFRTFSQALSFIEAGFEEGAGGILPQFHAEINGPINSFGEEQTYWEATWSWRK